MFKNNDRVVLIESKDKIISLNRPFRTDNPAWGCEGNFIVGTVERFYARGGRNDWSMNVKWDNGMFNGYDSSDWELKLHSEMESPKKKGVFGTPVKLNTAELDKLVMDADKKQEIVAVLNQHEKQDKLFNEWGLGDVIEYGKGMTFLFYGPPGTGKTWAAHCIGKATGREVLVISAAEIQSSEPGGANRNIKEAFAQAKKDGKILFLDECDSLIFNREQLGMILGGEVNTLLTEIEQSEGIVILATNRVDDMDAALERRIALILEFPEPNQEQREAIWGIMLPKKMPLGADVTPKKLAKEELTGGLIKNVVLHAARLALSEDKDAVSMSHFKRAIERVNASKGRMGSNGGHRGKAYMAEQNPSRDRGVGVGKAPQKVREINPYAKLSA